ncbi:MAG: hypothetical protein ACRD2H_15380, partial [Terriglobales bacterium]
AAARALEGSAAPGAFAALRATVRSRPEAHVMTAALAALATSKNPQARPGVPERIRAAALEDLASLGGSIAPGRRQELNAIAGAALADPFLLVRMGGEDVAAAYRLRQFEPTIERAARTAPLAFARDNAAAALQRLRQ